MNQKTVTVTGVNVTEVLCIIQETMYNSHLLVFQLPSSVERWRPSLVLRLVRSGEAVIYVPHNSLFFPIVKETPEKLPRVAERAKVKQARKVKDKVSFARGFWRNVASRACSE